jgi:hypothetical protein
MKKAIKSIAKNLITANEVISNIFYGIFKEKISINVRGKSIGYYMNPRFGRPLPAIDINGEYEGPFLSRLIEDMLHFDGDKIYYLDIGGSFGFDVLVVNSFLPDKVAFYTFEPDKFSQIYFKKNVTGIPVKVIEKFVSDRSNANSIAIDDFCEQEGIIPTHIKIDIEGGEISALKGMVKTLKNYKPKLYIEFHEIFIRNRFKMNDSAIEEFFQTLKDLGYKMEFNSHHYPLFSGESNVYDYNWVSEKPNSMLYAVICT